VFGKPGRLGAIEMSLYPIGLCSCGESIMGLVPEGGAVVSAKFFIQEDVAQGLDLDPAGGRVPS
jgi:hypothetical protein